MGDSHLLHLRGELERIRRLRAQLLAQHRLEERARPLQMRALLAYAHEGVVAADVGRQLLALHRLEERQRPLRRVPNPHALTRALQPMTPGVRCRPCIVLKSASALSACACFTHALADAQ